MTPLPFPFSIVTTAPGGGLIVKLSTDLPKTAEEAARFVAEQNRAAAQRRRDEDAAHERRQRELDAQAADVKGGGSVGFVGESPVVSQAAGNGEGRGSVGFVGDSGGAYGGALARAHAPARARHVDEEVSSSSSSDARIQGHPPTKPTKPPAPPVNGHPGPESTQGNEPTKPTKPRAQDDPTSDCLDPPTEPTKPPEARLPW